MEKIDKIGKTNLQDYTNINKLYEEEPLIRQVSKQELEGIVEEAKKFHESFQSFKKKEFFSHESVYLVSTKWLRRWKKYVSFDEVISEKPYSKFIGCGAMPFINEDIVDTNEKFTLEFHQKNFAHLNTKLKNDLCEGKDFEYLDEATWTVLSDSFQGYELRRMVEDSADGKIVELYFQKVSVVPIVNEILKDVQSERITKLVDVTFQFSKYATIKQFKEVAGQIMKKYVENHYKISIQNVDFIKFWLMPEKTSKEILLNTLIQGCKANSSFDYTLFSQGKLLSDEKNTTELNIFEKTIILAQLKQVNKNWIFFNLTNKLKVSCNNCRKIQVINYICSCKYAVYCTKLCKSSDKFRHKHRCPNLAESDLEENEKQLKKTEKSMNGLAGLKNPGGTCSMNSAFQCASHIPQLTQYFLSKKYLNEINKNNPLGTKGQLATEYAKMIENLWLGQQPIFAPRFLQRSISRFNPMLSGCRCDSGLFITNLMSGLHEDLNRVIVKYYTQQKEYEDGSDTIFAKNAWQTFLVRNQSIIVDLMYGQYKSKFQCSREQCKNISITFDPFLVCILPIPTIDKAKVSLFDCLKLFEQQGQIVNRRCSKCKNTVAAKKHTKIFTAPKILTFYLTRAPQNAFKKIQTFVDFPIELDLAGYLLNPNLPEDNMGNKQFLQVSEKKPIYDLFAVINHFNNQTSHHTSYCKDPKSGDWYDFDDSIVTKLKSAQNVVTQSAYMLFYKRR